MNSEFDFPDAFFVTGTDTGVGKTLVSAMLTLGLQSSYWKPIQAGCEPETDTGWLRRVTHIDEARLLKEAYVFSRALSPHAAAAHDGQTIYIDQMELPVRTTRHLVVEGAGGILVPLNNKQLTIDLVRHLGLPVLIVARSKLGTINHTLMTIEALRLHHVPVLGVVMNAGEDKISEEAIERHGHVRVLAHIDWLPSIDRDTLLDGFGKHFDRRTTSIGSTG